ncbi:MAG: hypothetical protein N3A54_01550 [Patescibacteria group bacterium]|nr:hypothetical protein [Patescibacteria group bacterium]
MQKTFFKTTYKEANAIYKKYTQGFSNRPVYWRTTKNKNWRLLAEEPASQRPHTIIVESPDGIWIVHWELTKDQE